MNTDNKYRPFDGSDEAFSLRIPSNENIRKVCSVLAECHQKDDPERLYYATHGELAPDKHDDDGNALYTFKNIYNIQTLWPALAQALFYDFPAIVDVKKGTARVVDQAKHDKLIRSEVMRGRDDFLGKFGMTAYEVDSLLSTLAGGLNFPSLNRLLNPETPGLKTPAENTKTPS